MDHGQIEWLTKLNGSHREWNSGLRSRSLGLTNGLVIMADELFVQLRNVLLDVSRQLQSYLSDELLESTVSRLQQIRRHLLVFAGTNSNLNDLIASISSVLSRLATCENRLYSSGYNAPVNLSGRPGRPKFDISREQREYFLFYDLGVQDIANALSVSKSTVQRRFREYGISVSSAMTQLTNDQVDDLVRQIKNDFPNAGYRRVDSQLRCEGVKVSQSRVREARTQKRYSPFLCQIKLESTSSTISCPRELLGRS